MITNKGNMRTLENQNKISKKRYRKHRDEIIAVQGLKIYKQHLSCLICGEKRVVEFCHVIPLKEGGTSDIYNIIPLCANHHYLFDQKKLTDDEYEKIKPAIERAFISNEIVKKAKNTVKID
jgi:5-methylcytosine-specific restriction endonuclease McrA